MASPIHSPDQASERISFKRPFTFRSVPTTKCPKSTAIHYFSLPVRVPPPTISGTKRKQEARRKLVSGSDLSQKWPMVHLATMQMLNDSWQSYLHRGRNSPEEQSLLMRTEGEEQGKRKLSLVTPVVLVHIFENHFFLISRFKYWGSKHPMRLTTTGSCIFIQELTICTVPLNLGIL